MKKCRSRIVFNRENETAMKNEISHNHSTDPELYENFMATAIETQQFGDKNIYRQSKQVEIVEISYESDRQ